MDKQNNGFDHDAESGGPEIDYTTNPTDASPEHNDKSRMASGREMVTQLQQMIDNLSYQAAPVIRESAEGRGARRCGGPEGRAARLQGGGGNRQPWQEGCGAILRFRR